MPEKVKKLRVMLVEDTRADKILAKAALAKIENIPIEVITEVGTLAESINYLRVNTDIDVVLYDLGLPNGSGREGFDRFMEVAGQRGGLKVIVLTANDDKELLEHCRANGASAIVDKREVKSGLKEAIANLRAFIEK